MSSWTFTWSTNASVLALLGGLLIGCVAALRMLTLGRVTGISGIFGELVTFVASDDSLFRFTFVAGLLVGGAVSSIVFKGCYDDWSGVPLVRILIGGFLVGFGTSLGSGCTSGHGVCGLGSLRLRSLVAVGTFMTTGIITATVAGTADYLAPFENTLTLSSASIFAFVCMFVCALLGVLSYHIPAGNKKLWVITIEAASGLFFAFALAISNMTKLGATLAFLDLKRFNPALMFVMGGAILVTFLSFRSIYKLAFPVINDKWSLPTKTEIDRNLVLGSVIFGVGWGLVGACPGPALANMGGNFHVPQAAYFAFMFTGFWSKKIIVDRLLNAPRSLQATLRVNISDGNYQEIGEPEK